MPFEARQLRVQLPCGPVTVMEAERFDAESVARQLTGWGDIIGPRLSDPSCGPGTSCGFHSGFNLDDLAHLCQASEPLGVRVVVDAHVLPQLRAQLELRLKELDVAQAAVSSMMDAQKKV